MNEIIKINMTDERLQEIGEWLNSTGYDLDLSDDLWMEDYVEDVKFRDLCKMLDKYGKQYAIHITEKAVEEERESIPENYPEDAKIQKHNTCNRMRIRIKELTEES